MKKKFAVAQRYAIILFTVLLIFSCSKFNKATDLIAKPSAKQEYGREYKEAPQLFELWEMQAVKALEDSVAVDLPYIESGKFFPRTFPVYSYEVALNLGERLQVQLRTDSLETLIFMDLFRQKNDSLNTYEHIKSAEFASKYFQEEISEPGIYKILLQPEIGANSPFQLKIYKEPVYTFPVASIGNSAVQSFWGAVRDGGRRSHEGVDIFAPRGTPVVAATTGRVVSTANKGLGGKQVWLRDRKRGNSLYYAHLDSIIATPGMSVSPGDTLGLVGNTGNARTTPPHLHFGIYNRGAVNPLHYVYQIEKPDTSNITSQTFFGNLLVSTARANLRTGPSTNSIVLGQTNVQDTLQLLGKTHDWYHVNAGNRASFIHESLVAPL